MLDESSLTGESLPVERVAGERVSSGVVNGASAVTMRAVALASDSEYQQIVRLVEQAAGSKAKVVRLADRYAVPFTVLSLVIAGVAWAVSYTHLDVYKRQRSTHPDAGTRPASTRVPAESAATRCARRHRRPFR